MGHRYITVALILGIVALPLSCGGDDDDTTSSTGAKGGKSGAGGKGGSGGKAGAITGGKAGKGGTGGTGGTTTAGRGGTGGSAGTTTAGRGGTSGTGGTGNVGNNGGQAGDGSGATSGMTGTSGENAGGASGNGAGGDGAGGDGPVDPAEHRLELVTNICNKPVPNDPNPGCGHEDECIAYMMMSPFGDSTDCVTKYDALLECRSAVDAAEFICGDMGVNPYPVDTTEDLCKAEADAAFYCTP